MSKNVLGIHHITGFAATRNAPVQTVSRPQGDSATLLQAFDSASVTNMPSRGAGIVTPSNNIPLPLSWCA